MGEPLDFESRAFDVSQMSVYVDPELKRDIRIEAAKREISMSDYARTVLRVIESIPQEYVEMMDADSKPEAVAEGVERQLESSE